MNSLRRMIDAERQPAPARGLDRRRGGLVIVAVLVCLLVASLIVTGGVRNILERRRQQQRHHQALQADWLARSAQQRALAVLARDNDYRGGTWLISSDDSGLSQNGRAVIVVRRIDDQSYRIHVRVDYPDHPLQRVQVHRTWHWTPSPLATEESPPNTNEESSS